MLLLYSKRCEYAIRALAEIPLERQTGGFSVKSVCKAARIPESFTRKVFQNLVKSRILAARPGPGGGYRFCKDPARVSILDIVQAVDGKDAFDKCILRDFKCDEKDSCPLHPMWMKAKAGIMRQLKESTVLGLIRHKRDNKETKR